MGDLYSEYVAGFADCRMDIHINMLRHRRVVLEIPPVLQFAAVGTHHLYGFAPCVIYGTFRRLPTQKW